MSGSIGLVPPVPPDPHLKGVRGLFGDEGVEAIGSFLSRRGWTLQEARPVQVLYRPGGSCVVRYRAKGLSPGGRPRLATLCAETRAQRKTPLDPHPDFEHRYGLPEPVEVASPYLVWAFPYDPALKGLTDAAWGASVRDELGATGRRPLLVDVEPLRYRPRRRAIMRYASLYGSGGSRERKVAYGKVLRTTRAAKTVRAAGYLKPRERRLGRSVFSGRPALTFSLPTERLFENTLLFDPLSGRSLLDLLLTGASLPDPQRIARLLDDVAEIEPRLSSMPSERHRQHPVDAANITGDLLSRLVPEANKVIGSILEGVARGSDQDDLPRRVVHGDLYDAQVFVNADFSLGLIDLDDLGMGDPALDAANFCAHLVALAVHAPQSKERILAYRSLVRCAFLERLGLSPSELAWREAFVMLQLATGPFRILDPAWPHRVTRRIDLAARLLAER